MNHLIKTMIVEDEKVILEDLKEIVNWRAEGFEIVATAYNGKMGLKQFALYQPELVISDIRMPLMDGLTMIKSIKLENPGVHFLILSAYDEFDYAKEAIRLGAEDYILKTEISPEYVRKKLSVIKGKLSHFADTSITVCEKKMTDYIMTKMNHTMEDLDEIFSEVCLLQTPSVFSQLSRLAGETLQNSFARLAAPDKYVPPTATNYEELKDYIFSQLKQLEFIDDMVFNKRYSPIVINALEYIRGHYMNPDLKIQTIADEVGISPGRLSVIFKKDLGETVNDIITTIRINQAKELLASGKYKVYEVSDMVGYKTSQYFSTIFYNQTGQYPNQYRKGLDS